MGVKTLVGLSHQSAIEALFAPARFVSGHKENRLTLGVKSESHSPFTIGRAESQFLHIGVSGALQSVNAGAAQLWPELLQHTGQRENLPTDIPSEPVEFRLKLVGHLNGPSHIYIMV
jgi:hypothetical protein